MSKLRLHVWVLPLQGPAAANKLPPFLLLAPPGATLKELSELIFNQHQRNYPDRPPLNIKKLQDSDESDIDLGYLVGDVFRDKDVVKVIQAPPERESSLAPQSALRPHLAGFPSKRRQDELGWWGPSSGSVTDQHADAGYNKVELRPHKRQRMQEIDRSPGVGQFDPDRPLPSREDSPELGDNGGARHEQDDEHNGEPSSSVTVIHDSQRSQNMGPPQSTAATSQRKRRHDNGHDIYTIPDSPMGRPSDPQYAPQKQGLDDDDESTKSESSDGQATLHNIPRSTMASPFKDVRRPASTAAKAKPASFVRPPLPPLSVQRSADGHANDRQRTVSTAPTTPLSPRQLLAMSQTASGKERRPGPAVVKPQPRATTVQSELSSTTSGHPVYDTVEMDLDSSPEEQRLPHRPSPAKLRKEDQSSSEVQVPSSSQMLFRNLQVKRDPVVRWKEAKETVKASNPKAKKQTATKKKALSAEKSTGAEDHDRLPEPSAGPLPVAGKDPSDHGREAMQNKAESKGDKNPMQAGSDTHIRQSGMDETAQKDAAGGISEQEEDKVRVGKGLRPRTTRTTTPQTVKNDLERSRLQQEVRRKAWEHKTKPMVANAEGQSERKAAREEDNDKKAEPKGPEKKRAPVRGPLASILHKRLSDGQPASTPDRRHSPNPALRSSAAPSDSSEKSRQGKRLSSTPLYPRASSVRAGGTNTAVKTTPPVRDVGIEAQMPLPASLRRSVSFADQLPTSGQKPRPSPSAPAKASRPFSPAANTNTVANRVAVPTETRSGIRSGTPTTYGKPYPGSPAKATTPAAVAPKVTPVFPPGKGPVDLVKHTQVWPPGKGPEDLKKVAEARQQTPAQEPEAKKPPDQVKSKDPPAAMVQTTFKASVQPTKKVDEGAAATQEIVISSDEEKSASSYYSSESADEVDEVSPEVKTKAEGASTEKAGDAVSPTRTVSQPDPEDGSPEASIQEKTRSPSPASDPAPEATKDTSRSASRSPARYLPDTPNDSDSEPTEPEDEIESDAEAASSPSRSPSKSLPPNDTASTTSKDVSMADAPAPSTTSAPPPSSSPTNSEASSGSSASSSNNPSQQIDLDLASQLQQTADQSQSQSQSQSYFPPSKPPVSSSQILPTHLLQPQPQPQRPKAASRFPSLTALVSSHLSPYEKSAVVAAGHHQPRGGSPLRNGTNGGKNSEARTATQSDSEDNGSDSSSEDDNDDDDDEEEEAGDPETPAKKGGKSKMAGRLSGLFNSMWRFSSQSSTRSAGVKGSKGDE